MTVRMFTFVLSVLAIVFSLLALCLDKSVAAPSPETNLQKDYYSHTCQLLHHSAQRARDAGRLFDEATDERLKSSYWDDYQVAIDERNNTMAVHVANIAFQAAAGNIPPEGNTCLL